MSADPPALSEDQLITVAPEIGINISDVSLDPDLSTDNPEGILAGMAVKNHFSDSSPFAMRTGVYFSQKGSIVCTGEGGVAFVLDYLEIPLALAREISIAGGDVVVQPYAGGRVGIEIACDVQPAGGGTSLDCGGPELQAEGAEFPTASTDFGLIVGGAVGFPVGVGQFSVGGGTTSG